MLVCSSLTEKKKELIHDAYWILEPHIPALLMTSCIQTAGHKMAALTDRFLRLSDVDFQLTGQGTE